PHDARAGALTLEFGDRDELPRRYLPPASRRDRPPAPGSPIPGRAARGPVPDSPPAPAGCVSLDRLSAPRADRRVGDRRRGAAPPATVAGPRGPVPRPGAA